MLCAFFVPFQNFIIPIIIFPYVFALIVKFCELVGIADSIIIDTVYPVMKEVVIIISASWALVYCIFRKGVFLYDDHLVIAIYTITMTNWKQRILVDYYNIESVGVNYFNLSFAQKFFSMLVPFGDNTYNVKLTLKTGKTYFFSVENAEEFCENLNLLLEKQRKTFADR